MSFKSANRGRGTVGRGASGRFGRGGGRSFSGSRGGRGGGQRNFEVGPPEMVIPFGKFSYSCEGDLVCKSTIEEVPYFSAPVYLENKEQIGKIDEIFGTLRDYSVTVKLGENIKASSFKCEQILYLNPQKLLPLSRFLPKEKNKNSTGTRKTRGVSESGIRGKFNGRGRGFNRGGRNASGGANSFKNFGNNFNDGREGGNSFSRRGHFGNRGASGRGRW